LKKKDLAGQEGEKLQTKQIQLNVISGPAPVFSIQSILIIQSYSNKN